jgi:two-component system NtrC family sensor kinase
VLAHARTAAGWTVVAEQPAAVVYASSTRMVEQSIFWALVSLVVALVAGLLLSQSINRPIGQLVAATRLIADGKMDVAIDIGRGDEFGRLAGAFEQMGRAVAERDAHIRAHNEELQQRVEARTRDLQKAHEQLLQSQKLAALNNLSAGIAHEINNPLAVVLASADLLLADARHGSDMEQVEVLDDVRRATERIRDIVARLGTLGGGPQPIKLAPFGLFALLQDTAAIFEAKLGGRTLEVVGDDDNRLPPLVGNATLLQHVVVQLLSNAVTATAEQGHIVVRCRLVGSDQVEVAVEDDGRGIPAEHLDQIFDPFFTTKDQWESVGLGLTVVHRIIEKHCGTIKISSRVGEGTTVTLSLPLNPPSSGEH